MANRLTLRILTPTREVLHREVDGCTLTALNGEIGILPGHAPLLAEMSPGVASFKDGVDVEWFALSSGFLEVNDDAVTALVQIAEPAYEIDAAAAEERRRAREEDVREDDLGPEGHDRVIAELAMENVRLAAVAKSKAR